MTTARMRALLCAVMTLLLALALPAWAQAVPARHLAMRLVAESETPKSGAPVALAIETIPETNWHGYWRNPGDAGFPATLTWTLPKGASVGAVEWPVPTTLSIAGLMNYVYERPYAPLVTLRVPAGLSAGTTLPVSVAISYLVCTDKICVPEQQTLTLALTVGDGATGNAASFDRWRRAIPKPLDAIARYAAKDGAVTLAVPYPAGAEADQVYFFPLTTGSIDDAAPQKVTRSGDTLTVATKGKPSGTIEGVLRIGADRGLAIRAAPGAVAAAEPAAEAVGATMLAFLGALLGGLILNVMPCV